MLHLTFRDLNLNGAKLRCANLSGANLREADLSEADLSEASLSGARLKGAKLSGAKLRWANLSGANLSWADLSEADLSEADLSGADLSEADLSGATIGKHKLVRLAGRAERSDGYEFLIFETEIGEILRAGCRTFTLKVFRTHVAAEYPDTPKAVETLRILAFLEAQLKAEPWA